MKKTAPTDSKLARNGYTVGRAAMEKINAVEGIVLSSRVKEAFARFDREDLSPQERRAELLSMVVGKAKR